VPPSVTVSAGAILAVASGVYSGLTVSSGHTLQVLSGGTDLGATVRSGGTLLVGAGGTDSGATILKSGAEKILFGGTGIGATISGGGVETVSSGGVAVGTAVRSGGTEIVSNGGTGIVTTSIGAGATVETANGGTAIVSGTIANSGTLIASGIGSLLEIDGSAVVSGGAVVVGNGIVDVLSGGTANVRFLSTGSGGLEIADTNVTSNAFTGRVSGFGGVNHSNHKQFIDLVSVTSAPNTISLSYVSANAANTSGTLFVSSGGVQVAAITMVGHYASGNFHITAGTDGTVAITDPAVPNGGSVEPAVSDITLSAHTTLAYSENNKAPSLVATEGRYAAAVLLLGNYMAGSFVAAADGHGGALITEGQTEQPLLAHPRA
jgi:autotransporter passenger strand-loop-strand repeat protein